MLPRQPPHGQHLGQVPAVERDDGPRAAHCLRVGHVLRFLRVHARRFLDRDIDVALEAVEDDGLQVRGHRHDVDDVEVVLIEHRAVVGNSREPTKCPPPPLVSRRQARLWRRVVPAARRRSSRSGSARVVRTRSRQRATHPCSCSYSMTRTTILKRLMPHEARSSSKLKTSACFHFCPFSRVSPDRRLDTSVRAIDLSPVGPRLRHEEPRRGFVHSLDAPPHQGEDSYPALCHVRGRDCSDGQFADVTVIPADCTNAETPLIISSASKKFPTQYSLLSAGYLHEPQTLTGRP